MERLGRALASLGLTIPRDRRPQLVFMASLLVASICLPALPAYAATLTNTSVALSDPEPSVAANYTFAASNVTTTGIECIQAVFATTSGGSTVPTGMDTTGATVDTSATTYVPAVAGFSLNNSVNGTLTLTDASAQTPASGSDRVLQFDAITNSSVTDTAYYMTLTTYSDTGCTSLIDSATALFMNTAGTTMQLQVDPTLSLSIAGVGASQPCDGSTTTAASTASTLPFGVVSSAVNSDLCQELTAATNATNGYTLYMRDTQQPTNPDGKTIADVPGSNAVPQAFPAPGTEAYGYTTSASNLSDCSGSCSPSRFTDGSTYNYYAAATTSNAEIGYSTAGDSGTNYYIGHQVGISTATAAGDYTTTIIYTCTPIY